MAAQPRNHLSESSASFLSPAFSSRGIAAEPRMKEGERGLLLTYDAISSTKTAVVF